MSLKTKLILASCGPLLILLVVGLISIRTITQSSKALERIFRENYDSVAAGLAMKQAILEIERGVEPLLYESSADKTIIDSAVLRFSQRLKFLKGNVTLPGEHELTNRLAESWKTYTSELETLVQMQESGSARRDFYRARLLPQSDAVLDAAQQIIDINLNNIISGDGQVRQHATETNRDVIVLVLAGTVLALIFVIIIGPSILRPISYLTRSVKEIQQGNLDLVVKARSGDEIGQLASAFNDMTTSLREFRRTNRARLIRTQKATLSALNSLSDAIIICNPEGAIELSNDTAERLFALKAGMTIQSVENVRMGELFERARHEMRPIRLTTYDWAIQVFRDGEEHFFLPEAVPIMDEERRLTGVMLILSDVTRLRKLDEVKSGLISIVSHELKTPLTSIRLAAHALLNEKLGPLNSKQAELVIAARDDSDRLYRIIENLLDIGRLESGRSTVELVPVSPEQVLLNVVEDMRPSYVDRGVSLVLDLPGDIPQVLADRLRLEIVFANLLSNGLKFTPPGGEVKISARLNNGTVLFSVEDTGSGIPKESLPHIFEKFFRVPGRGGQPSNTGLGLAIVKEIIEAHGSRVEVASTPGEGTKFSFTLAAAGGVSSDMKAS
ncbi:Multi-sensor signal transduction histidine kinase [Syntrophobacter sp. SbD2]|nr:Multi-sensor signal transduction histidine kinase [Syntrophobacter sp. SbD2]